MLVGPCGSGKSTLARQMVKEDPNLVYINQDAQGRDHLMKFGTAVELGLDIVCDRMNFTKGQRSRYLDLAKANGYTSKIIVLHQSYDVCFKRCVERQGHETIKEESAARSALNMFFSKYERVEDTEADVVERQWPDGYKPSAIICDLDGTLCEISHRLHFVRKPKGEKKNWKGFFDGMLDDKVNKWCADLLHKYGSDTKIVLCSGRPDNYRRNTVQWLEGNLIAYDDLFMRNRGDQRQDNVAKEIILDFEILTRYTPFFMIDDRSQVVAMWRKRGYTCLQCAEGDF